MFQELLQLRVRFPSTKRAQRRRFACGPSLAFFAVATVWSSLAWLSLAWAAIAAPPPADGRLDRPAEQDAWAPPGLSVDYSPLERRLFQAAAEGRVDWRWLLAAALAAGGEQDEASIDAAVLDIENWRQQLWSEFALADESIQSASEVRRQAEAVLEFLHARVLRGGYRSEATELSHVLAGRGYNCVGATVLYHCLAECCGLSVSAAEAPGHVFAVVRTTDGELVVETTCRDWFRTDSPLGSGSRHDSARQLSPQGLAALVYYNAGVDLLSQRRFAEALAANLKALRLDPANPAARSNLLAGLNNWALDLSGEHDFAAAVRLLEHGLRIAPEHRPFRVNFVAVHQRWIEALIANGQYEAALDRLAIARGDLPDEPYFESAAADIRRRFAPSLSAP